MKITKKTKKTVFEDVTLEGDAFKVEGQYTFNYYFMIISEEPLKIVRITLDEELPGIDTFTNIPSTLTDCDNIVTPCTKEEAMNQCFTVLEMLRQAVEPEQPL
jgi:hypothetical protein